MCASCTPCKEYRTVFQAIFVISFGKRTTIVKFRKISSTIVLRSFTIVKFRSTKFYEILRNFTIVTIVKFYDRKISYYDRRQPVIIFPPLPSPLLFPPPSSSLPPLPSPLLSTTLVEWLLPRLGRSNGYRLTIFYVDFCSCSIWAE